MILILIQVLFWILVLLWCVIFYYMVDLSIPSYKLKKGIKTLLIFPHADDETFTSGGYIHKSRQLGNETVCLILTKGEKGTPKAEFMLGLSDTRTKEAQDATRVLGITRLIQEDFGDGELYRKKPELKEYITKIVDQEKPDRVISFDTAGIYGHEDHITSSKIVTEVLKQYPNIELWYATHPTRAYKKMKLPEHMAKDPEFVKRRTIPTLSIFLGTSVIAKIRAMYRYKSQFHGFQEGKPIPFLPLWYFYVPSVYEYFHKVQ